MSPATGPRAMATGEQIALFAGHATVTPEHVIALWEAADVVDPEEARRRVREVLLVGTDPGGTLVAVGTVYLAWNEQLRLDLWHYRTYVDPGHRRSVLADTMADMARAHLEALWVAGLGPRSAGVVFEVESEGLRARTDAVWPRTRVAFVGAGDGVDVRVRYFPGALAPLPPA